MSEKIGQGAQPSPVDGDIVMTLLDRLLVQLRVAEDGLKDLGREGMGSFGVSIDSATDELRACQDKVRSAESKGLPQERLQSRMTAVKTLSRRVQVLLAARKAFTLRCSGFTTLSNTATADWLMFLGRVTTSRSRTGSRYEAEPWAVCSVFCTCRRTLWARSSRP